MEVDLADDDPEPREIGLLQGFFGNMKLKPLSEDVVAVACAAVTKPDGTPYYECADSGEPKFTSAKVYSSLFVRHWDSYVTENKNSVWYGRLERTKKGHQHHHHHHNCAGGSGKEANRSRATKEEQPTTHESRWRLAGEGLTNLLARRGLECPVPPFGGTGDFDISSSGIAFVARDPAVCPASHTKTNTYFVPLSTFSETSPPAPKLVQTPGLEGYSISPVFSPCGKSLAFARMRMNRYESDKPRLLMVKDVTSIASGTPAEEFYATQDGEGGWDLRPDWILWSNNGKTLYVAAEKQGRIVLWQLPSSPSEAGTELPTPVIADGSVYDARVLSSAGERLFVTSTSIVDSSIYSIFTPGGKPSITLVSSNTKGGKSFGLSKCQFDEFWFCSPGSLELGETTCDAGYEVHALVMKPSNFDPSKKYPLAMLIHGGPQGAWIDSWSTRWNPAIFAEQGYVAVMPNPTGSTGYGMRFQNSIRENWGGRPYRDIEACFRYLKSSPEFDFVDTERAVALGASYGGYMINWIQGHPLGRKFKALVCHDGVFSTLSQFSSEELYFPVHDFGGTLWDNREGYAKWDPAKYTKQWATPELVSVVSSLLVHSPWSESQWLTLRLNRSSTMNSTTGCRYQKGLLPSTSCSCEVSRADS